jgi:flagellar biosynthetic protein FlhB
MAGSEERESRTEEPTERKLNEAIERGQVPFAREAIICGSLLGILAACASYGLERAGKLADGLRLLIASAGSVHLEVEEDAWFVVRGILLYSAEALAPFLAIMAMGGIIASLFQNAPQLSLDRIRPQASRLSLSSGWKRLFGLQGFSEFLKSLFKFLAVGLAVLVTAKGLVEPLLATLASDPAMIPQVIYNMTLRILWVLCAIAGILAAADIAWSRFKWRRDLRMSRQEIKDEHKQQEGDPLIKLKIRTLARQRSARRIAKTVPRATMVLTNPTHYAVALRYVAGETAAPIVVAKGIDHLAQKIRELAVSHNIPIVENKPLARALYEKVAIDSMIPAEFYKAVAEIIHFLQMRRRARR